ncbi:MAG: LysR family transcriptional regulator [Proteobacteria bacterium]|nr:LysR family transcriptional regulator [Pseudomonadota bacterium]
MELHQLRCFLAVVEEGGFNRATTRLHISQPALSYQIKQLEQELNTRLFHRRPGGISTTEAGRVLSNHAREVLEKVRKAHNAIEELADGVVGEVRIGTANSVGIYFLPRVLWSMREKYPMTRPTVLYRHSNEILDLLSSNRLDLALVANPRPDRRLRQETVIEERISLVCGQSHPLFGKKAVKPSDLEKLQFISLSAKSPTGQLIREYLVQLDVNIEPVISTDNVETVKKMVEVGLGVAFLPDMVTSGDVACEGDKRGRLSRIAVGPPLSRRIVMVTWKNFEMSRATDAFVKELRRHASEWRGCVDIKCA